MNILLLYLIESHQVPSIVSKSAGAAAFSSSSPPSHVPAGAAQNNSEATEALFVLLMNEQLVPSSNYSDSRS